MKDIQPDRAMIKRQAPAINLAVSDDSLDGPDYEANIEDWDSDLAHKCAFWSSRGLSSRGNSLKSRRLMGHLEVQIRIVSGTQ